MELSSHSISKKRCLPTFRSWARYIFVTCLSFSALNGCVSTTEGGVVGADKKQMMLISSEQVDQMSSQTYDQMKSEARSKGQLDTNPSHVERVQSIAKKLTPLTSVFRKDAPAWKWESHVITSDEINAFCLPGGKIMFYSGIIEKLKMTDGEIAAVMGHEIAHALREHGRARISQELAKQGAVVAAVKLGVLDEKYADIAMIVSTVTLTMRHSRGQESESDDIGVELMARAGYDPNEAISLWKKMQAAGGAKPPEILSTHPSDSTRIERIQSLIPKVMPLYLTAKK